MCQRAKRTSRAGSPLSKNYIGAELHAIKSLQKIKKSMKFCPVEGSVAWYKNRYQESTEAPVVGSDLKNRIKNCVDREQMASTTWTGWLWLYRRPKVPGSSLNIHVWIIWLSVHHTVTHRHAHTKTKKTENTPCLTLTALPLTLTRHTGTPGR